MGKNKNLQVDLGIQLMHREKKKIVSSGKNKPSDISHNNNYLQKWGCVWFFLLKNGAVCW